MNLLSEEKKKKKIFFSKAKNAVLYVYGNNKVENGVKI
jgi:hypothetical protein